MTRNYVKRRPERSGNPDLTRKGCPVGAAIRVVLGVAIIALVSSMTSPSALFRQEVVQVLPEGGGPFGGPPRTTYASSAGPWDTGVDSAPRGTMDNTDRRDTQATEGRRPVLDSPPEHNREDPEPSDHDFDVICRQSLMT
ncbi:uncharacterized protein LOC117314804 [Pecten maximus]|uniref:uncharacterized protein LOC117314804 n=1 Tax=Pecten maximus TaxID=6579 RepID=UPI001458731A|nr:uncharacterized protein LOC117314804 [Pecten maximus]